MILLIYKGGNNIMKKSQELAEGAQGCLGKAKYDEMLFILRAQDVSSPKIVLEWIKENLHCNDEKLREAFECVLVMKNTKNTKSAD